MLDFLETPLTVLHICVSFFLVLVVLLQPGKSGGLGAALGGAGAQQVFGGRGAGNFLSRLTWISAGIFFLTSILLAYISSSSDDSLADLKPAPEVQQLPSPPKADKPADAPAAVVEEQGAENSAEEVAPQAATGDAPTDAPQAGEAESAAQEGKPALPEAPEKPAAKPISAPPGAAAPRVPAAVAKPAPVAPQAAAVNEPAVPAAALPKEPALPKAPAAPAQPTPATP